MKDGDSFDVQKAVAYLRSADPVLAALMDRAGPYAAPRRSDPYAALVRAILYQQLAGAAAASIQKKFFALYSTDDVPPSPAQILETTDEQFRSVGVSRQKAGYLRDLAM